MHEDSHLTILLNPNKPEENGLKIGFTHEEMAARLEDTLRSIALTERFAPIVYVIGHGATSANNPHYAAYNCGACSGRPGSVNGRVFAQMANMTEVRQLLREKGIDIPSGTVFIGGLHDTTRDEVTFFDTGKLSSFHMQVHEQNLVTFRVSLQNNVKERARRFELLDARLSAAKLHRKVRQRAVSLFEPRPELNHATNALCIIGRRSLTKGVFLDRRAFTNSYDYRTDPDLRHLFSIMKPIGPVCGGINLEYYFSRVDNRKLGAGTKLPHNVMGLVGVTNGVEGDLRPGLPEQMIEVHDPLRLLTVVEQYPDRLLATIQRSAEMYEWYINEWIHLAAIHPETAEIFVFRDGRFELYEPLAVTTPREPNLTRLFETEHGNLPVYFTS